MQEYRAFAAPIAGGISVLVLVLFPILPLLILFFFLNLALIVATFKAMKARGVPIPIASIALLVALAPALWFGHEIGPTFGAQVPFNKAAWSIPLLYNVKYHMADDLVKKIGAAPCTQEDIIDMLGKPTYRDDRYMEYFLRPETLMGLAYASLEIEFERGYAARAWVAHQD
jgi:hypothetical protein